MLDNNESLTGSKEMLDLDGDEAVQGNERSLPCVEFAEMMQRKFMERNLDFIYLYLPSSTHPNF